MDKEDILVASPSTEDSSQTIPSLSKYTIPNVENPPFPMIPNGDNCLEVLLEGTLSLLSLQWKPRQLISLHARATETRRDDWVLMCNDQAQPLQFSYPFSRLLENKAMSKWL